MRRLRRLGLVVAFGLLLAAPVGAEEVISWVRPDGRVAVTRPAPQCLRDLARPVGTPTAAGECPARGLTRAQAIEWVRQKDVPADAREVSIHDDSLLPPRSQRAGWQKSGGVFSVDRTKVETPPTVADLKAKIDAAIADPLTSAAMKDLLSEWRKHLK